MQQSAQLMTVLHGCGCAQRAALAHDRHPGLALELDARTHPRPGRVSPRPRLSALVSPQCSILDKCFMADDFDVRLCRDLEKVVAFAADRAIRVIPEIE